MKRKTDRCNILLTFDSSYSSSRRIASGALRRIAEIPNWDVTMLNFRNRGFQRSVRLLAKRQPFDGVIADSDIPRAEGLEKALPKAIFINAVAPTFDWARFGCMTDNIAISDTAAEALLRLKPRSFVYVGAQSNELEFKHSRIRERRFKQILSKNGQLVTSLFVDDLKFGDVLTTIPKPIGIFAYNDTTAAKVLQKLKLHSIPVPEQASVIGVDNDADICENTHPSLSSINPDFEAAGRLSVEILAAALDGQRKISHRIFGVCGIVERESTQSAKTGSRMVAAARNILQQRYAEKLSLDILAHELNISQRLLTLRFREITGHSVHEELQEIRLAAARKQLESRTKPVKEIAAACGFKSLENFYRQYRCRYGKTPCSG